MSNVVESFERQKDFQRRLKIIENQCVNATNQMKQVLLKGEKITLSNQYVMNIYIEIYRLAEESGSNATNRGIKTEKSGEKVEEQLIQIFVNFLNEFIHEILKKVNEYSNEKDSVLRKVSKAYHDYKACSYWLFKMFYYLDKFAMPARCTTLCSTSLKLLKDGFFEENKPLIHNTILQYVQETRQKRMQFNLQIKQIIELFSVMGSKQVNQRITKKLEAMIIFAQNKMMLLTIITKSFSIIYYQKYLIQYLKAQNYYKDQISEKLKFTTPEFVNWGNSIFELEQQMAKDCYPKSEQPIENKLKLLFVKDQAQNLVQQSTGVAFMLQSDRTAELKNLYDYIKRTKECIHFIAKAYLIHFGQEGLIINSTDFESIVIQEEVAQLYFTKMFEIMEKAQAILKDQFSEDPEIQKSYNVAFSLVLNQNDKTPLWLAIYTDIIIRSENGVNEMEMDQKMSKIIQLYQLLYQKDDFFKHYKKFLQMRLLNFQDQNLQQEKQLLQKFKGETDTNVPSKLSSMINDIEQSIQYATDFTISEADPNLEMIFMLILLLSNYNTYILILMSKNVVESFERQKDFQRRLKIIENQCISATNHIKQGLLKGETIKMTNAIIMNIYKFIYILQLSEIYKLAEESGNVNATKSAIKTQKSGEKVEEQLIQFFVKFLNEFIQEIFKKINECSNEKESVLREVSQTYHDYKAYSYWLFKMFYYLDKFAMPAQCTTLCSTSLKLLKDGYFERSKPIILNTILQFIQETRQQSMQSNKQIKQLIELFSVMGSKQVELKYHKETGSYDYICLKQDDATTYYNKEFQYHLLLQTQNYYKDQISEKLKFTTPEFVNWGNSIFELEQQMAKDCYPKSEQPIENKLKLLFVKDQAQNLVQQSTGVAFMLQSDRTAELKSLYDYIKRTKECVHYIAKAYQIHFEQEGLIINSTDFESQTGRQEGRQINVAELYFTKMLEIMEKAQAILKNQFSEDPEIQKSYNGAFSLVLNKNDKTPLWLAIYTDIIIRSEKGVNEMEMDKKMGKIVQLFQLLYQRDVFFRHYQKFLQMRLLNSQNQNLQQEKQLLQKFKGETGTNVLSQLSSMINDIEQSNRFATDFSISEGNSFDFNVYLLSQGCWPLNSILDSIVRPLQIQNTLDNYEKMYTTKHTGRIVTWCFNLGQGELIYRLPNDKYYLSVNTLQIVCFLQFNKVDSLTVGSLLENVKIDRVELENTLIPFVCLKILQRQKADLEDFSDETEVLRLNFAFANKAKKMRMLPNPKMQPKRQVHLNFTKIKKQEINAEEQQQQEQLNKQREFVVDSQLVRLMKSRKSIKHHELLDSCQQMISIFKPDVLFIKKRIENLIEREYIKRDEKDWYYLVQLFQEYLSLSELTQ